MNVRDKQYHSEHSRGLVCGGGFHFNKKKQKNSEILSYHVGCCVSHISLGLSVSIPETGRCQGESERQLFLPLCPLSSRYLSRRRGQEEKKQQNQRDKLHPPTNVWTNVKAGQRGNFSIISTAAMLFSVKGDVQQGRQLM